jgi:hypothetical protein
VEAGKESEPLLWGATPLKSLRSRRPGRPEAALRYDRLGSRRPCQDSGARPIM